MNSAGISVFYGALSEDTAISEVRPYVGSLVVVGQFDITENIRVLDLSQIGIGFAGSIFDPEYESTAARYRFLEGFHSLIAKPIQPHEEQLEYIPTQAVAEYVSNVLGFNGILYGSAQLGAVPENDSEPNFWTHELSDEDLREHNIVLFGDAATVDTTGEVTAPYSTPHCDLLFHSDSVHAVKISKVHYTHEVAYFSERMDDYLGLVSEPIGLDFVDF